MFDTMVAYQLMERLRNITSIGFLRRRRLLPLLLVLLVLPVTSLLLVAVHLSNCVVPF
jgi:hypothetical protein